MRLRIIGALLLAASGCSDPMHEAGTTPCSGHVTLQVGRGNRPTISWLPACGVGNVFVVSTSAPATANPQWVLTSFSSSITPPLVYGTKPAADDVFQLFLTDSLTVGAEYTVTVSPPVRGVGGIMDSLRFTVQASTP